MLQSTERRLASSYVDCEQLTLGTIIFNIHIDISQAKVFCSLLTLARGHSDLAMARPPLPPRPAGYGPGLDYITGYAVSVVCRLQ
jgi:hypothetical protein